MAVNISILDTKNSTRSRSITGSPRAPSSRTAGLGNGPSRARTVAEVTTMLRTKLAPRIAKAIQTQSMVPDAASIPMSAPLTAIRDTPPNESAMILIAEATPMRLRGTRSRTKARPGP